MDTRTNHLIRLDEGEEPPKGYEPVPTELQRAAIFKLAGRKEATVSRTSGGKLSRWAAMRRNQRRKARKRSRASRFREDFCN